MFCLLNVFSLFKNEETVRHLVHIANRQFDTDEYYRQKEKERAYISQFLKTKLFTEDDPSDGGINWIIFPASVPDDEVWKACENLGMCEVRIYSDYDCTGKFFASEPYMTQTRTRKLVKQSWGYDI